MKRFCFAICHLAFGILLLLLLPIAVLHMANAISVARLPAREMARELIMVFRLMPTSAVQTETEIQNSAGA